MEKKINPQPLEEAELIAFLRRKLAEKKVQLRQTRSTLSQARIKVKKMKAIIAYQRERIVQLYSQQKK